MNEPISNCWPRWIMRIEEFLPVCSQFLVSGNIRDVHLAPSSSGLTLKPTINCLWQLLSGYGCEFLLVYDRIDGVRVYPPTAQKLFKEKFGDLPLREESNTPLVLEQLSHWLIQITSAKDARCAFVIDYASRLISDPTGLNDQEFIFFAGCQKLADIMDEVRSRDVEKGLPYNPILWLIDRPHDLPDWFGVGNERTLKLVADLPDRQARTTAAYRLAPGFPGSTDLVEDDLSIVAELFAELTDGLTLRDMMQIRLIARNQNLPFAQIADAVRCYKVGIPDNPWRQGYLRKKIQNGERDICARVKGQASAVQKTLDILKRSVMGLSGAQGSVTGGKPRGILFFAGPTGVGKTELAKSITHLVFGDEQAYIRFDMSEFSSEHSDARLIGAPPGYVGYDAGGELVNAVRQHPFCVILFDEIEKAHPRILDKFLQILEDGRLTDGRGETVYFSESVIVFTSNLGIYVQDADGNRRLNVKPEDSYADVTSRVRDAIEKHFRYELQRPELLNRIGENIVIFDFIRSQVAKEILDKMLCNVRDRLNEEHGLVLEFSDAAYSFLVSKCTGDLTHGGRGIGNMMETVLINPLARELFGMEIDHGSVVTIITFSEKDGVFSLEIL